VLAGHEGRLHNRTYLALPLLERVRVAAGLDADATAGLLIADVVRHETGAGGGDRPDPRTLRTRLHHAHRFLALGPAPQPPAGAPGAWFALSVQPVSTRHDEYFFIRALQCHEMVFTVLAGQVAAAARDLRAGDLTGAAGLLRVAGGGFERAAQLFRIVATMRAETFHEFREHTQGASAIQSESYKRFELACGTPTPERLGSDAFASVPTVAAEAGAVDDVSAAYLAARRTRVRTPREWALLDLALADLEARHQRWKASHRGLAARMLGSASGSGYTAGVPYLQRCLRNRLFWRLGRDHLPGSAAA
jgi:tryptophan 2,3-dioxygenase